MRRGRRAAWAIITRARCPLPMPCSPAPSALCPTPKHLADADLLLQRPLRVVLELLLLVFPAAAAAATAAAGRLSAARGAARGTRRRGSGHAAARPAPALPGRRAGVRPGGRHELGRASGGSGPRLAGACAQDLQPPRCWRARLVPSARLPAGLGSSPAQPSPAQPSPAQPSPAQPSPAHLYVLPRLLYSSSLITYLSTLLTSSSQPPALSEVGSLSIMKSVQLQKVGGRAPQVGAGWQGTRRAEQRQPHPPNLSQPPAPLHHLEHHQHLVGPARCLGASSGRGGLTRCMGNSSPAAASPRTTC
jgi:hypothetical protein